jgi:hypothetical protein
MIAEAVRLLEAQPAGLELVGAYTYLAGNRALTGHDREALVAARRALALAAGSTCPSRHSLHWRGLARLNLGEADGLEDMRLALHLALEARPGPRNRRHPPQPRWRLLSYEGPQAALDALTENLALCERRGTAEFAPNTRAASLDALAELGRHSRRSTESGRSPTASSSRRHSVHHVAGVTAAAARRMRHFRPLPTPTSSSPPPAKSACDQ